MMRARVPLSALLSLAIGAAPGFAAQPTPPAVQGQASRAAATPAPVVLPPELARVLRDYEAAWRAGDGARLAALFVEDGFAIQSGSPIARGRAAIAAGITAPGGPLVLEAYVYSTSGTVGYIVGGYRYEGRDDPPGRFVLALRLEGGRWLIGADLDNAGRR